MSEDTPSTDSAEPTATHELLAEQLKSPVTEKIGRSGTARGVEAPADPAPATVDDLFRKKAPTRRVTLVMSDEDGEPVERYFVFQTLAPPYYDELIEQERHKPRKADKDQGLNHNPEEFSLTLISEAMVTPKITREQVVELRDSGRWSRGELGLLYRTALDANHGGLEIPFTKRA